jgi:hypothetical protein
VRVDFKPVSETIILKNKKAEGESSAFYNYVEKIG